MDLNQRIAKYITNNAPVDLDTIILIASSKGFTELEVLTAMETIHKDKRFTQSSTSVGKITYRLTVEKVKSTVNLNLPPYPYPLRCEHCQGNLCAECFPFYDPERDTIEKIKERNDELKRNYDKEKAQRGSYTKRHLSRATT